MRYCQNLKNHILLKNVIQHRNFEIYQIFKKKILMYLLSEHAILVKVVLR